MLSALRISPRAHAISRASFTSVKTRHSSSDSHTSDSYNKDVDSTPPSDPKIHRVDAASDAAHKPHEPAPTTHTTPTETTSKEEPYTMKGAKETGVRYGAEGKYEKSDQSKGGGPDSDEAGGRKPERR